MCLKRVLRADRTMLYRKEIDNEFILYMPNMKQKMQ